MRQFDINATDGDTTEDIPSALNLARKGDIIYIRDGTYIIGQVLLAKYSGVTISGHSQNGTIFIYDRDPPGTTLQVRVRMH